MKKGSSKDSVKVVIRCRPLTPMEKQQNQKEIVHVKSKKNQVYLRNPEEKNVSLIRKVQ
jgi:hypothetical protein